MDRTIVYPGSIPLDTDLLHVNRNAMVALGAVMRAVFGSAPVVDGLQVVATSPNSMSVMVGPGCLTTFSAVDYAPFGSLPADGRGVVKMGVNLGDVALTLAGPGSAGQSIAWLIEGAFAESDVDPVVLPYYNAANPAQPWLGPANSGAALPTSRVQLVQLQARAGAAAPTGSQVPPAADAGWVGIAVVTVGYGQGAVGPGDIMPCASAPVLPYKLPELRPGFASLQAYKASGWFVVPAGVTRAKVTVVGGGGAGGTHASLPGGGGGAGGRAVRIVTGLMPGAGLPVTVGGGGEASASPGPGGPGGTSSFGSLVSATGGAGGGGGTSGEPTAGGAGGYGVGGDVNEGGAYGTDSVLPAARGGDGGGPGGGRGTTGALPGVAACGPGGGGGGSGCSQPGGGTGAVGGNGAPGLVIIEF